MVKAMVVVFQPYSVLYYLTGFGYRQLSTFVDEDKRNALITFIKDLGGVRDGDWYRLPSESEINSVIAKTRAIHGQVFNLPLDED
jgi:hypothetical protein